LLPTTDCHPPLLPPTPLLLAPTPPLELPPLLVLPPLELLELPVPTVPPPLPPPPLLELLELLELLLLASSDASWSAPPPELLELELEDEVAAGAGAEASLPPGLLGELLEQATPTLTDKSAPTTDRTCCVRMRETYGGDLSRATPQIGYCRFQSACGRSGGHAMKFVDSCEVKVVGGKGGNGAIAFRREKFIPFGGPSGGDGGRGGDVVFLTDPGLSTLLDLTYAHTLKAESGEHGMGSDCYGKAGQDLVTRVPVGTQVIDAASGELLFDLDKPNERTVVARGGKGGRGNIHFASSFDRAPRRSEPGDEGEEKKLRLELKVMADVGLLGFPNVGKSTFIRAVSRARPKVADYPFTTLVPHLGVVSVGEEATFVLADIPGLIQGAAEGAGLGVRFLKHVERTRALLHLVTLDPSEGRDPLKDWAALNAEMEKFDPELAKRPQVVAMTKADLPEVREAYAKLKPKFKRKKVDLHLVSAATGEGVRELTIALYELVKNARG
jgi:GTP-binding protein